MRMMDTALEAAEWLKLRDRTPMERVTAGYHQLADRAEGLAEYLPSRPMLDPTSLVVGLVLGVTVGAGLALYYYEDLLAARKQAKKALASAQESLPVRLNITRMAETADEPAQ